MHETTGLRERKKAETRAALCQAALRLATDHGADSVTADAIAEAANVSVRTFHNYFPTKDEAFLEPFRVILRLAVDEFRARPSSEPILVSLEQVWSHLGSGALPVPDETLAQVAQLWTSPGLAAYRHRLVGEAIRQFVPPVAERSGMDPVRDLYPALVTTVAVAAIFTALEHCPAEELTDERKSALVHESFELLRSGLDAPIPPTHPHLGGS